MNKEKKKTYLELGYNIVGAIISLIMMIFGILAWSNYYHFSYSYENVRFGADFYTEIYKIFQSTKNAFSVVGNTILNIHNTIGSVVTLVSILMIFYFVKKIIACAIDLTQGDDNTLQNEHAKDPNAVENAKKAAIVAKAQALMNGSDIVQYRNAEELLISVAGYAEADEKLTICRDIMQQITVEKQTAYANAKKLFETAVNINDYSEILKSIETLEDVCDTSELKKACNDRIEEIKTENRIQKKLYRRKVIKKALRVFLIIIIVSAVCLFIGLKFVVPHIKYTIAMNDIEKGDYTKAYDALILLGDYKDSIDKATSIQSKAEGERIKIAKVGDFVRFGSYEQDNNTDNGQEAIEWEILDIKGSKALIITKFGIVRKPFHDKTETTVWSKCTLRQWLNDEFITEAFAENELAAICETNVSADKNPKYSSVSPGPSTKDKVFILSYNEAEKYFKTNESRMCIPTEYAVENGTHVYENGYCWWPLRTPGKSRFFISYVFSDGELDKYGFNTYTYNCAVRPVMWVDTSLIEY